MPITIKSSQLSYKNSNGEYTSVDMLSDSGGSSVVPVTVTNSEPEEIEITSAKFNLLREKSNGGTADSAYAAIDYDDSGWTDVRIPHDWSIELDFDSTSPATYEGAFLNGGEAWYRTELPIDLSMNGKALYLNFDGVYMNSEIFVNGTKVGENNMGYNPFRIEITDYVSFTGANVLAVFVRNYQISSRYYSGSGIYRPVKLVIEGEPEVTINDIFVTTPNLSTQYNTLVDTVVECEIIGSPTSVTVDILDRDGHIVGTTTGTASPFTVSVLRPKLWGVYAGNLYTARITVTKDNVAYIKTAWFGYRYIAYDATGFYLNGEKTFLKGVCMHHDLGCIGAEANYSAMERQLDILIEMGINAVRTSHNPQWEDYLLLCAKKGLLVQEEFFDTWRYSKKTRDFGVYFLDNWEAVVNQVVKRDRNNPAIIMWSIGNEISTGKYNSNDGNYDTMVADCTAIHNLTKQLDPTRYTTTAQADIGSGGYNFANVVDIIGLNYASESNYNDYRRKYPNKPLHGSETTSALSSRGEYVYNNNHYCEMAMPELADSHQCSSYDNNVVTWFRNKYQNEYSAAGVVTNHMNSTIGNFGMFVWTGFDYLGEPTPYYGWPTKSSFFGIVDLAGFPKDIYYMYQSQWTSKPMMHILPMKWDFETGSTQHVWLYTNCASMELFMNGVGLGTKTQSNKGKRSEFEYNVTYEPGVLVANGYDSDGNLVAQDVVYTSTGFATGLALKAWYNCVDYRTPDLAFIECDVVDINGVRLPDAINNIMFTVDGGTVLGTDNGNSPDTTNMHSPSRNAFHGKALCVVRHDGKPGTMTITASSDGLWSQKITVEKGLYTGRTKEKPTAFIDATNPPAYPNGNVINMLTSEYPMYNVTSNLTNATLSRTASQVLKNSMYSTQIETEFEYKVSSVTVTMGGTNITNSAYDSTNQTIVVRQVTGDIIITVSASKVISDSAAYSNTNLVFDGTNYVDTGIKLMDSNKSWKIEFSFTPADGNATTNVTILHNMVEVDPYNGFVYDIQNSKYRYVYNTYKKATSLYNETGVSRSVTIFYNADLGKCKVYDGSTTDVFDVIYTSVPNTLLLGSYVDTNGNYGRYFKGTINSIDVYIE